MVVASLELLPLVHCLVQLVQLEVLVVIRYCCRRWSRAQAGAHYDYYRLPLLASLLMLVA